MDPQEQNEEVVPRLTYSWGTLHYSLARTRNYSQWQEVGGHAVIVVVAPESLGGVIGWANRDN